MKAKILKRKFELIISTIVSFFLLLTIVLFSLLSNTNKRNEIILTKNGMGTISSYITNYDTRSIEESNMSGYIERNTIIETNYMHANSLINSNKGIEFIPLYYIDVVIIRNNDKATSNISSFKDLLSTDDKVGLIRTSSNSGAYTFMGLLEELNDGVYNEDVLINYLKTLDNEYRLSADKVTHGIGKATLNNINLFDYVIAFDSDYRELISKGNNVSMIKLEKSISIPFGFLIVEDNELSRNIKNNIDYFIDILNNHSFNTSTSSRKTTDASDIKNFNNLMRNKTRILRRDVQNTYKFSGVDGIERNLLIIAIIILLIPWAYTIFIRVVNRKVGRYILAMLISLTSLVILKYLRSLSSYDSLDRYIWYLSYIPMSIASPFWIITNLELSNSKKKTILTTSLILFSISTIFFLLVLTNDFHQLIFRFNNGLNNWGTYSYSVIFWLFSVLSYLELLFGFVLLLLSNAKTHKRTIWITGLILIIDIIFIFLGAFSSIPILSELDFSITVCIISFISLEAAFQTGLIKNNGKYKDMIDNTSLSIGILNKDNDIEYKSKSFLLPSSININSFDKEIIHTYEYNKYPISNGTVIYANNISDLIAIRKEIEYDNYVIENNNKLLLNESELKTELTRIEERNKVYNELDALLSTSISEVNNILNNIDYDNKDINLGMVTYIISLAKQKSNLYLQGKKQGYLLLKDLLLSIKYINMDAKRLGVNIIINQASDYKISIDEMLEILNIYDKIARISFKNKKDVLISINKLDTLSINAIYEEKFSINLDEIKSDKILSCSFESDDDASRLMIRLKEEKL